MFEFLGKILNICNKELGTPFERCSRVFENAIADCNAKLGPLFNWLCSLAYIVKAVCYIVKVFDYVCMIVDFISNSVVGVIIRSEQQKPELAQPADVFCRNQNLCSPHQNHVLRSD